jgi:hypothetical protein
MRFLPLQQTVVNTAQHAKNVPAQVHEREPERIEAENHCSAAGMKAQCGAMVFNDSITPLLPARSQPVVLSISPAMHNI